MRTPIIHRQLALSRIGELRTGGEKPASGVGKKLEHVRGTTQHKDIAERFAGLYGGKPLPWESPNGPAWQVYSTAEAIPCMVIVGYSLRQQYEKWEGATKCVRRCDGEEEQLSGGPCICNTQNLDEKQQCDIVTRLMVVLHETGTSLGWQLRSIGENAARELAGAMMVAGDLARGRAFVPATLRITQRRSVIDGQTVRYVVPILDFNLLDTPQAALEPAKTFTPIAATTGNGVTVVEALEQVNAEAKPRARGGRQTAPIGPAGEFDSPDAPFGGAAKPLPVDEPETAFEPVVDAVSVAQKKKLNVLVGTLRENHAITTEQLWSALARSRSIDVDTMIELLSGRDEEAVLHWSPLRDSLTKLEASDLIERLSKLEQNVEAVA